MSRKPTKAAQQERDNARTVLLHHLKPGDTVHTILRHVSSSGMSRSISLIATDDAGGPLDITYWAARAMGDTIDQKRGGIKATGCGMDMGFALVYALGATLWPKGTDAPHGTRNGAPDREGGYALKHRWL
jgi:hypothetical protein